MSLIQLKRELEIYEEIIDKLNKQITFSFGEDKDTMIYVSNKVIDKLDEIKQDVISKIHTLLYTEDLNCEYDIYDELIADLLSKMENKGTRKDKVYDKVIDFITDKRARVRSQLNDINK